MNVWTGIVVAVDVAIAVYVWCDIVSPGPAAPPRVRSTTRRSEPAAAPDPGATGGTSLTIDDCTLVTSHGVELEIGDTSWTLDEVCAYVAWVERLPGTVEVG